VTRQQVISEVVRADNAEGLTGHPTSYAAIDAWRQRHHGVCRSSDGRSAGDGSGVLAVEGTGTSQLCPTAPIRRPELDAGGSLQPADLE
jgi:hypothetical protein